MSKQLITQRQLKSIIKHTQDADVIKQELRSAETELLRERATVFALLKDGATIEEGPYNAVIGTKMGSVRPPWKDVYLRHAEEEHNINPKVAEELVRSCYPAEVEETLVVSKRVKS